MLCIFSLCLNNQPGAKQWGTRPGSSGGMCGFLRAGGKRPQPLPTASYWCESVLFTSNARSQGFLQSLKTRIPSKTLRLALASPKWQPSPRCLLFAPLRSRRGCAAATIWALLVLCDSCWAPSRANAAWSSNNFVHILVQVSDSLEHTSSRPFLCSALCLSSVLCLWRAAGGWWDHLCGHLLIHTAPRSLSLHFLTQGTPEACSNNQTKLNWAIKWMSDLINVKEDDNSNNHGWNNCKADLQITRIITLLHF